MISFLLIFLASLFFMGIVVRTKSLATGRKGPGLFQPVRDVWRLFRKGSVFSQTTTFIFQIAPTIYFSSVVMAILMVPFGSHKGLLS